MGRHAGGSGPGAGIRSAGPGRHAALRARPAMVAVAGIVLVAALVAGAVSVVTATRPAAAAAITCKDFYVVSARGSGERSRNVSTDDRSKPADVLDGSPETRAVFDGVLAEVTKSNPKPTFQVYNLNYPAKAVNGMVVAAAVRLAASGTPNPVAQALADRNLRRAVADYLDGEAQAEQGFGQAVGQIHSECASVGKTPKIVLLGYSQGAMALHNYLVSLPGAKDRSFRESIVGAVLVADPERMPASAVTNHGSARADRGSYGVCLALETLPKVDRPSCLPDYAAIQEIPETLRPVTSQICDALDSVCDFGAALKNPKNLVQAAAQGIYVHTGCHRYCKPALATKPAADIARRILATPSTPTEPVPVTPPATGCTGACVYAWGRNHFGVLGGGEGPDSDAPGDPVAGLTDVVATAAGSSTGYALRSDGTVWGWGRAVALGIGPTGTYDVVTPTRIPTLRDITAIATSNDEGYALAKDGTLWTWGLGVTADAVQERYVPTPERVVLGSGAPIPGVVQIATTTTGGYALTRSGTVYSWGSNRRGEWGDGDPTMLEAGRSAPNEVGGLPGDVVAIGAGGANGYAITRDGSVWGWGDDLNGQLGPDPHGTLTVTPVRVRGVTAIAAITGTGSYGAGGGVVALGRDGYVWTWGDAPRRGEQDEAVTSTPTRRPQLGRATAIAGNYFGGVLVRPDGTLDRFVPTDDDACPQSCGLDRTAPVPGLRGVRAVSVGLYSASAVTARG